MFRKYGAPFCVYLAPGILERTVLYWWGALEELILNHDEIEVPLPGEISARKFPLRSFQEKVDAFDTLD